MGRTDRLKDYRAKRDVRRSGWLEGEKLRGGYALTQPESVLTGRTNDDLGSDA